MSGQQPAPCPTGTSLTDPVLCGVIEAASTTLLSGPDVTAPTLVQNELLPADLKTAIQTGSPLIGYNFESGAPPVRADRTQYTVDTYTTSIQNSAVLVKKPEKTTGTLSGVTGPDSTTGKSTATVTYTVNGTSYTFTGSWDKTVTNGETVDVWYKPDDVSRGSLTIEGTGVVPPDMATTPGYELIDFQSAVVTGGNLLATPTVANVDECANQCDDTPTCTGFNFGGLDTDTVCQLVKDATTTREYVDNKVGFVKENIPTAQTGDGSNRPGTDLSNQGAYCEDAPACNRDIARVINDNSSASDPIASFSTSDLSSCAYCPIRKYNRTGHVTTNEVGVSKTNASPADAITQLQYQADGTFASHMTLEAGKCYDFNNFVIPPNKNFKLTACLISAPNDKFKLLAMGLNRIGIYVKSSGDNRYYVPLQSGQRGPDITSLVSFEPVDYVTNGYQFVFDGITLCAPPLTPYLSRTDYNPETFNGAYFKPLNSMKYSSDYEQCIAIPTEITIDTFYQKYLTKIFQEYYEGPIYPAPPVFINASDVFYYVSVVSGKLTARKLPQVMIDWYIDVNPSWGSANSPYMFTFTEHRSYETQTLDTYPAINKISDPDFWSFLTPGPDMPEDPYEQFGQYRTLDVAPPPAAQDWAYARRQGCDRNCGSVPNGYAIYKCTASGGGNCDPGKGAYVSGDVCAGTHISCRPADNSTDMKAIFSYQFAGLRVVSSVAISGGSNSDHNTDSLRIRTIYENDPTQTVTTDITKVSTLFRPITQQRLAVLGIVQPTVCAPGLYVTGSSPNKYCAVCPGNPQPTATQVWRPDPNNPGATLCAFDECPQGKTPDALHGTCRGLCTPGTTSTAGGACSTCPRMQYPWWSVSSATSGPGSYWPDAPIPINLIWKPNSIVPGTYLCEFMQCEGSAWGVDNNTRCGGRCLPGTEFNTTTSSCSTTCTVPPNTPIDRTWDYDMIDTPDGSGQVATYKCTMRQCPTGFYASNYNDRYCDSCGDDTTTSFTFNAAGFHTQYGYTAPSPAWSAPGSIGDWTVAQKRAYCTFVACKPGYQNYVASSRSCTQSCPTTPGFTTTFSSGCTVSSCTVNPGGGILTGGLAASGQCEATVCNSGYGLSGGRCVACTPPQGATVVYDTSSSNQTCRVTSCTLTGTGPPNVGAYEVVNGQCSAICSGGFYLDASGWCSTCSTLGGAVNQTGTVPVYTKNTCQITSCGVDSTLTGKATATVESVQNFGWPPPQYCKTSAAAGYYKLLNGSIFQCPAGDPGTQYTYRTSADGNCDLATCSLSMASDPNEIAYKTYSTIASDYGQTKCSKVCRSGYKRNASDSNKCSSQCTGATTDPGITVTYGPYECKIASCTSSTGYPASSIDGSTCQVVCPSGSQQVIDTQGRTTCTACSSDLNIAPWSYAYVNTGTQFGGTCSINYVYTAQGTYGGCQAWDPDAATVTQSGSTCVATCKTGYVKDSIGFCRPCLTETPTSRSTVTNGVCVATCKTGHLPNDSSEFYKPVCQKCDSGYRWDGAYKKCMQCNAPQTTSTNAAYNCTITCRQNYFYNSTTGICTICPARTAGLDDPGVRLDGYDDTFNNRCKYIFENIPPGEPSTNTQWCVILPTAKNVSGTVLTRLNTNPTTWACTSTCRTGYFKSATKLESGEINIGALTAPRAVTNQPTNLTGPANFTISMDLTIENTPFDWVEILQNVTGSTWPLDNNNRKPLIGLGTPKQIHFSVSTQPGTPSGTDPNQWVASDQGGFVYTPGTKFNFTATHNAATATIAVYINGVLKHEKIIPSAMVYATTNTFTWRPTLGGITGYIKVNNAYWINRVLSATEITNIASGVSRECDMCAIGYRWDGMACVACGTNRTTPSGPASGAARAACVCKTGYTGSTCMSCATNYTWNGSACVACQNSSTIVSGPASGPARSCVCPSGTYGSVCTACTQPIVGTQYVYATCTTTTNTDIRDVGQCSPYNGVPQYRSGYVAGSSTSTGQQGTCTPCQVPPVAWNNPNFTYISTACGLTTDSALTTPTACQAWEYRSGFQDGTQAGRPGNPGTCQPCSNPGTNQWVGQVCGKTTNTVIYDIPNFPPNTPACTNSQYRSGFSAGNYNTRANFGTCTSCSNPGTGQYVTGVCTAFSDTQIATVPACPTLPGIFFPRLQYHSGFNSGTYSSPGYLGMCAECAFPATNQYVTQTCSTTRNTELATVSSCGASQYRQGFYQGGYYATGAPGVCAWTLAKYTTIYSGKDQDGQTIGRYTGKNPQQCVDICETQPTCKGIISYNDYTCYTIRGAPSMYNNSRSSIYLK